MVSSSFVLTENFFVIHDHFVRFNVLKFFKSNFTWDSPLSCFEEDKSRGSYVSRTLPICSSGRETRDEVHLCNVLQIVFEVPVMLLVLW